jgi:hypothetical protein
VIASSRNPADNFFLKQDNLLGNVEIVILNGREAKLSTRVESESQDVIVLVQEQGVIASACHLNYLVTNSVLVVEQHWSQNHRVVARLLPALAVGVAAPKPNVTLLISCCCVVFSGGNEIYSYTEARIGQVSSLRYW